MPIKQLITTTGGAISILEVLQTIFAIPQHQQDREREKIMDLAIDLTVTGTDPRLRLLRAYKKRLREAIEVAVAYVDKVVEEMPPSIELSAKAFSMDPQIKAYFASTQEFREEISNDQQIQTFAHQLVDAEDDYIYLGLAMEMAEKNIFVPSLVGEVVQREVARTAVNLSAHRFVDPCGSEKSLRRKIKERVFMDLVQCALTELSQTQHQKVELQQQRSILRAKLAQMQCHALGLEPFTQSIKHIDINYEKLETRLAETEESLKKITASIATLDEYLELIKVVMANPANYINVENASLRLTRMNLLATTRDEDPGEEIIFTFFTSSKGKKVVGRLIKYPRTELLN